jgi:TRAP-type C4-dicarboxylate transport system permease small subunit
MALTDISHPRQQDIGKDRLPVSPIVGTVASAVAMLGGGALVLIALMTCASILGRLMISLGGHAIPGDFELVEAGTAFVVCAFLPWCHLTNGHAAVTVLTDRLNSAANRVIGFAWNGLLTLAACVITWQHILGLKDRIAFGDTSFILRYPIWWAYAACLVGLICWIGVGMALTFADIRSLAKPRSSGEQS